MSCYLFPYAVKDVTAVAGGPPWNVTKVNAQSFWPQTRGDGGVIAVIDTGLDLSHPEFKGKVVSPKNFTSRGGPEDVTDGVGHGTHVAGTIGGHTCGVGPDFRIMPLKMFVTGSGDELPAARKAFRFLLEYNDRALAKDQVLAVNCSWGGPYDPECHYLIRRLTETGVGVVVAAGNAGDGKPDTHEFYAWPGFLWEVVTTGALNRMNQPTGFSSSYDGIDIGAPGEEVYSAWPGGYYRLLNGTSMAAPHVTGAYGLIVKAFMKRMGRRPKCEEVEQILFKHVSGEKVDPNFAGHGPLSLAWKALNWPLYRAQIGAYYNRSGAEATVNVIEDIRREDSRLPKPYIALY